MAAERIHKALNLSRDTKGALRVLGLHPLLNPAAYVSADVDPDFVHVRRSPAYEDGSWISLISSPVADLPLQAIVAAVDPHLRGLAPIQKWAPLPPEARCGLGFRMMSNSKGRAKTSSSKFAEL